MLQLQPTHETTHCIQALPQRLGQLRALRVLSLDGCSMLLQLPDSLCSLAELSELNLEGVLPHATRTCDAHLLARRCM